MKICRICGEEKKLSEYTENKRSKHTGVIYYKNFCKACSYKYAKSQKGLGDNGRFKAGLTPWNRKEIDGRYSKRRKEWGKTVLQRDNYTCQKCNSKLRPHAHHIKPWDKFPMLRFDLDNGLTLCRSCHAIVHGKEKCNFLKNGISWIKGRKMSKEHRQKLSEAHKGITPVTAFNKGHIPWNKGKKMSEEYCKMLSEAHKKA